MKQYNEQQNSELIKQLKDEEGFLQYIELLRYFTKNYVVMLVACDTPWGPAFTREMTRALKKIGLTVDLYEKYRLGYAAVIDAGLLVFEKLSPSVQESVKRTIALDEDEIELRSVGYDAPEQTEAYIKINGKIVSTRGRGLNFVVYDKREKMLLDAVNFDVFSRTLVGKHLFVFGKEVEDYLEKNAGTTLVCFNTPFFPQDNLTWNENFIRQSNLNLSQILANLDKAIFSVNRYYDKVGVEEVLSLPKVIIGEDGSRRMTDQCGELVNIENGHRITELQPKRRRRTIFLLGDENVFGVGVSDLHTMASFLQALFVQNLPEEDIVVENYGQCFDSNIKSKEWNMVLESLPVCPRGGDIILWNTNRILGVPFIDMARAATEARNVELFLDKKHYTPHGHKLIADKLYEGILEQELLRIEYQQEEGLEEIEELSVEELKQEEDYFAYVKKLKKFVKKYTIMIVSHMTPAGKYTTLARTRALRNLGFKTDLYLKNNHAYAAVLDGGNVIYEELSSAPSEIVEQEFELNGNQIKLRSYGEGAKEKIQSYIKAGERMIGSRGRGLLFVVFDKNAQNVLDEVMFNISGKSCACTRVSKQTEIIIRYQNEHPDVVLVGYSNVLFPEKNLTEYEKYVVENKINFGYIKKNINDPRFGLHAYYVPSEIVEVCTVPKSYHDKNCVRHFYDSAGVCVNILGGHRVTRFQPEKPKRTLFILGGCQTFGVCNSDEHTVASYLQRLLNQNHSDEAVIVQNYGFFIEDVNDQQSNELLMILEALPVKSGDIVMLQGVRPTGRPVIDMSQAAIEPRSYEIFVDRAHYNPDGQRLRAEKLYEGILKYDILSEAKEAEKRTPPAKAPAYTLDENDTSELAEYKRTLLDFYNELNAATEGAAADAIFGCIVMNCNPFTFGHRYLIDQALTRCDYLVVFVVEEDKSIFPFEDRFRLVVEGTEDLPNVILIPSGRFIISSLTFSEYFNKSELQERVVDTSMDVLLFAREIAPCLHIKKRFAGEEPFDAVTRQYNESMKKILPEYGMEFVEIPRTDIDGEVISASRVRVLLEKKNFDAIKKLVPEATYRYLIEKFG